MVEENLESTPSSTVSPPSYSSNSYESYEYRYAAGERTHQRNVRSTLKLGKGEEVEGHVTQVGRWGEIILFPSVASP